MAIITKSEKKIDIKRKLIKRLVHFNQTYNPIDLRREIEENRKKNQIMLERIKEKEEN